MPRIGSQDRVEGRVSEIGAQPLCRGCESHPLEESMQQNADSDQRSVMYALSEGGSP